MARPKSAEDWRKWGELAPKEALEAFNDAKEREREAWWQHRRAELELRRLQLEVELLEAELRSQGIEPPTS